MEMRSSACSEKVNLRVYLKFFDAKYGVVNYGYKIGTTNGVVFGIKKLCKFLVFKYLYDLTIGSLLFKLFEI